MTMRIFSPANLKIGITLIITFQFCYGSRLSDYLNIRNKFLFEEDKLLFGSKLELSNEEKRVNGYLMSAKYQELDEGFKNPSKFLPAKNFLDVREEIRKSLVHKMIRKMPKGAVLHAHDLCLASLDFVVKNLTHLSNLYACLDNNKLRFHFFEKPTNNCNWTLMEDLRKNNVLNDTIIKQNFNSLMTKMKNEFDQNVIWIAFHEMFEIAKNLLLYRPAFEIYLYQALQELYDDNVMYVEIRLCFATLYELDGSILDSVKYIKIFKDTVEKFVKEHPKFLGAKIIYSVFRQISGQSFDYFVETFKTLKSADPDLIAGFDLVGQEDLGETILNFAAKLLEINDETKFYFHAGETNWYGQPSDENLIDAVLLKSRRIGHGVALLKHPKVLEMVKNYNIAIELNPISSQISKYGADLRNHPASYFFANNFPVVVSNDDPSFWGAEGLSDDFYEAFMGIMSRKADLRALKQLAVNSITYSSMNQTEQTEALKKWGKAWDEFINHFMPFDQKTVP